MPNTVQRCCLVLLLAAFATPVAAVAQEDEAGYDRWSLRGFGFLRFPAKSTAESSAGNGDSDLEEYSVDLGTGWGGGAALHCRIWRDLFGIEASASLGRLENELTVVVESDASEETSEETVQIDMNCGLYQFGLTFHPLGFLRSPSRFDIILGTFVASVRYSDPSVSIADYRARVDLLRATGNVTLLGLTYDFGDGRFLEGSYRYLTTDKEFTIQLEGPGVSVAPIKIEDDAHIVALGYGIRF